MSGETAGVDTWSARIPSWAIPLLFGLLLIPLFLSHNLFEEWDGLMQYFAGRELMEGGGYRGWSSHFWPPLYSLLIGLGGLVMSGLQAGKLISCLAGVALLLVSYRLAMRLSGDRMVALLSQAFLAVNHIYLLLSFQAENHMLDALFFVSALLLMLKALDRPTRKEFLAVGLLCGLAGLSRYTSYALVPTALLVPFLVMDRRKALPSSGMILAGFALVSSPWWIYNTLSNGWPLHTWQHLNIGAGVVAPEIGGSSTWWWSAQADFRGILDIFLAYPGAYLQNWSSNLIRSIYLIVATTGVLAPFLVPAIFRSLLTLKVRVLLFMYSSFALYLLIVTQAFIFKQVFISWIVFTTIISLMFYREFASKISKRFPAVATYRLPAVLLLILGLTSAGMTSMEISSYLADETDGGNLTYREEVTRTIRGHASDLEENYVMTFHPARAYYAGTGYMSLPSHYTGSLDGLPAYRATSDRIRTFTYAHIYPLPSKENIPMADYLVYDEAARSALPQFSFLLDPDSDQIPDSFEALYRTESLAVFAISGE
ncbi:MAG: glycosyltransferase family 39 protein [Balneolaceae bacterium]|nr:glycosyltransferase family 39 protein [Balneolaceae bacterium]